MIEQEQRSLQPSSDSQRLSLSKTVARYHEALVNGGLGLAGEQEALAWKYLTEERGLGPSVDTHLLGVVPENPEPGHEHLVGRLVIPYLRRDGQPLKMRFRAGPNMDGAKYLDEADAQVRMYNVSAIHRAAMQGDSIVVCEAELDALTFEQCGIPAVGLSGTASWRSHYRRALAGFNRVWIAADNDSAGMGLASKIQQALPRSARAVKIPREYNDINETYVALGADAICKLVQED